MKKLIPLVVMLVVYCSKSTYAQCSFTVSASSTESRCRESGSITLTPFPAGFSYIYQIVSGPVTTTPGSSSIYTNLPAGNYIVNTTLAGCTVSTPVTVAGSYVEPGLLTASSSRIACPDGTSCITVAQPSNGRLPYSYSIISGPVTRPSQTSLVFCDMPGGDYTVQAFDSCGIVRTTTIRVAYDTGNFYAYTYSYDLQHANCTDLIVCPSAGFTGTSSHTLMRVWYVTPLGDTLKVNNFEYPVRCDTLIGYSHSYGNWQMLAYDTCGRVRTSTFTFNTPGLYINPVGPVCGGFQVQMGNAWKYNVPVGYDVYKCSDNSLVYSYTPSVPAGWYSTPITLEYDTCYYFVHYNSCGDTLRTTYTAPAAPSFSINGCDGPACSDNGKGTLTLWQTYLSGSGPITFTILSGPERVGTSVVQGVNSSFVSFQNMLLGTYTVAAADACGVRDTITITLDEPLVRTVEVTQLANCSGGANLRVRVTSNFYVCAPGFTTTPGASTYVTATSPNYTPVNIVSIARTSTTPSVWEADYLGVNVDSVLFRIHAINGCGFDTTVAVNNYTAPVLSNLAGYNCSATNIATVDLTQAGGVGPFTYRVRTASGGSWSSWQNNTIFTGMNTGAYEIEIRDACPNGSISSFNVNPFVVSPVSVNDPCVALGNTVEFSANPAIAGISYEWVKDAVVIGTGPRLSIPNFQITNGGTYTLRQIFPGSSCVDSSSINYMSCFLLPIKMGKLSGTISGNISTLSWKSLQEESGAYFNIERSYDGNNFTSIETIPVKGIQSGSDYRAYDTKSKAGKSFYRIKYTDANGNYTISNIINLILETGVNKMTTVSPVPFVNNLNVSFYSASQTKATIKLYDVSGKIVLTKVVNGNTGSNKVILEGDGLNKIIPGIYIIEIITSESNYRQKLIKR